MLIISLCHNMLLYTLLLIKKASITLVLKSIPITVMDGLKGLKKDEPDPNQFYGQGIYNIMWTSLYILLISIIIIICFKHTVVKS